MNISTLKTYGRGKCINGGYEFEIMFLIDGTDWK